MKNLTSKSVVVWVTGCVAMTGCAANTLRPEIASSADSPEYAVDYPALLNGLLTRYTEDSALAKEHIAAVPGYPDALNGAEPQALRAVYEEADRNGRSRAYALRTAEANVVRDFFDREKDDIARRINGGVTAAVEKVECRCELETYGAVNYGLKEGVTKRVDKTLTETGEGEQLLNEHEKAIGKRNLKPLSEQAAQLAWTAHTVYVALPTLFEEMQGLLKETKSVRKTLNRALAAEKEAGTETGTKAERRAREKRILEQEDALNAVDIFAEEANRLISTAETDIPALRSDYDKAFRKLIQKSR